MTAVVPDPVDPGGLLEYSVVYNDRSLNHMSVTFQEVMRDVSTALKRVYHAHSAVIVPGSGTFGMEAVARQFATGRNCLVIRNGWFSYRWTQIFDMGAIPATSTVLKARQVGDDPQAPFAPAPIEEVEAQVRAERPDVVFAPHVETSAGIRLPQDYLQRVAAAVHEVGGLFVLDCVAAGTLWVDMESTGVDVLITAPQKGWTGTPCCAMVMLSARARERIDATTSSSFSIDLRKWLQIMETYEGGGHAYHATLPTDGLRRLREVMAETEARGLEQVHERQQELGDRVRELLHRHGYASVAADGFAAPSVVVSHTRDSGIVGRFAEAGLQVAGGVPLMCDEPDDYQAFRIGLFGLDKLDAIDRTVERLDQALTAIRSGADTT